MREGLFPLQPLAPQSEGFHPTWKTLPQCGVRNPCLGNTQYPRAIWQWDLELQLCMALLIYSLIPEKKNNPQQSINRAKINSLCWRSVPLQKALEENPGKLTSTAGLSGQKGSHRTQQVLSYSTVFIFLNIFALEMATTVQLSGPAFQKWQNCFASSMFFKVAKFNRWNLFWHTGNHSKILKADK